MERLEGFVSRQFQLDGELVEPFSVVFLKTDAVIRKLFWDDEEWCWRIEEAEEFPEAVAMHGDEAFSYPHLDLAGRYGLVGEGIVSFTIHKGESVDRAVLRLASGKELRWVYNVKSEGTVLEVRQTS